MEIKFNLSIVGELDSHTKQVIAIARHTKSHTPPVQSTTTRAIDESDDAFIRRLRSAIRKLIAPFGYEHHVVLHCRDKNGAAYLTNDQYQNITRRLWFVSENSKNHLERVNALVQLAELQISS